MFSVPTMRTLMLSNSSGISAAVMGRQMLESARDSAALIRLLTGQWPGRFVWEPDGQAQPDMNSAPKRRRSPEQEESTSASWAADKGNQQLDCAALIEQ